MTRFVVDASVIVSAALTPAGLPRQAIALARTNGTIALSPDVFDEIAGVLARPRFVQVMSADRRAEILELISVAARWYEPLIEVTDCRDPKDNRYLELALAAGATAIISGDDDLLVLDPWRGIRIVGPAAFIALIAVLPPPSAAP